MAEKKKKATPQELRAESIAELAAQIRAAGEATVAAAEDAVARLVDYNRRMAEAVSGLGNDGSGAFVAERHVAFLQKAALAAAIGHAAVDRAEELAVALHAVKRNPELIEIVSFYAKQYAPSASVSQ